MSITMLVWNIERFALTKAQDQAAVPQNDPRPAVAYAAPFAACLPTMPPLTGGLPQNELAGQAQFFAADGTNITFGVHTEFGILARSPWHTMFVENSGANKGRLIKIWSVHFEPQTGATTYPGGKSTNIYEMCFDGSSPTMLEPVARASVAGSPWLYGYTREETLDNVLVAPKQLAKDKFIVNRVVGTPPTGMNIFKFYTTAMSKNISSLRWTPTWSAWWKSNYTQAQDIAFRRPENYGHIRSTSNHMALVVTV
jgi:hypothetical protein